MTLADKNDHYWRDMEPVPDDSEFFADLCGLIEEHSEDQEEMLRLLCSLSHFKQGWLDTYSATGALWMMEEE